MKSKRVWHFGNDIIKEDENYEHLGIISNKYLSKKLNIATDKLKGTYFRILLKETLHPLRCSPITKLWYYQEHCMAVTIWKILRIVKSLY